MKTIPPLDPAAIARFWAKVDVRKPNQCWEWQAGCDASGYGVFGINRDAFKAPRVAFRLRYDMDPGPWLICHTCHNRACVNWRHLYAGTPRDNTRDALERGSLYTASGDDHWTHKNPEKVARGTRAGGVKLRPKDVLAIRAEYADRRASQVELARRYGVTQAAISALIRRRTWAKV
jgi:hypothetical protein